MPRSAKERRSDKVPHDSDPEPAKTVSATSDPSTSLEATSNTVTPELTDPEASLSDSRRSIVLLMEANYAVLLRLVRRRLHDRELAADLVNEAVAICLEHLRTGKLVKVDQGIAGYVFKVSMNLLRNYLRNKNNATEARADSSALESLAVPPQRDDSDDQRLRQLTREMLESLTMPRDRAIVERFYLDEEDKESICRDLGVTSPQFNLVISRARQRMRRLLEDRGLNKSDLLCLVVGWCLPAGSLLLQLFAHPTSGSTASWLGIGWS
jgi:RNA polymerase sigma-70 factor (ECF subfamily)